MHNQKTFSFLPYCAVGRECSGKSKRAILQANKISLAYAAVGAVKDELVG